MPTLDATWEALPPESAEIRPPSPNWRRYTHRAESPRNGRYEASSTPSPRRSTDRLLAPPSCPLATRPWRRCSLPIWDVENIRTRLRCAAYGGPSEKVMERLQQKLDVERRGLLSSEQLRRVVRLKMRIPACNVSDRDLASIFHMLDFEDADVVRVSDFVDFVLADGHHGPFSSVKQKSMAANFSDTRSTSATRLTASGSTGTLEAASFSPTRSRSASPAADSIKDLTTRFPSRTRLQELTFNEPAVSTRGTIEDQVLAACQRGDVARLRRLLVPQRGMEGPLTPELGGACVHLAAGLGHTACCDLLLRAHANPESRDRNGATLLARAALYGHTELAQLLLKQWRANPLDADIMGRNAVHVACLNDIRMVQLLAAHTPSAIHARDAAGRSCFFYALGNPRQEVQTRIVQFLLFCNSGPNAVDNHGRTALAYAGQAGNREVVSLLLSCGARPRRMVQDSASDTLLDPCRCFECSSRSACDTCMQLDATLHPDRPLAFKGESTQLLTLLEAMATMPRQNLPAETSRELFKAFG